MFTSKIFYKLYILNVILNYSKNFELIKSKDIPSKKIYIINDKIERSNVSWGIIKTN